MTRHSTTRVVPYSAGLMFQVVADVEQYPQFLPWVAALAVTGREHIRGRDVVTARMTVGFKGFRESYTSRVILDPAAGTIDVAQTDGPFRILENHWRFTPEGEGCRVDFSIEFEFRNPLLNAVAGAALGRVMMRMEEAFVDRARKVSKQALKKLKGRLDAP
ncbi:MAG TPA: type II toxin-antitoxin system RatA family toxin [Rhizomicrobium sp.]|nr:type II toxin-antitoxin system RatA family toxin [Rhizomicrobium sp.]